MSTQESTQRMGRRRMLQLTAAGTGAAIIGSHPDIRPVEPADAINPILAGAIGAYAGATAYALYQDYKAKDPEEAAEEASSDVIQLMLQEAAATRRSANKSRLVDQANIIEGIKNIAYEEGKINALEAIDDDATESETITAAHSAANEYFSTPQRNFFKQWEESVTELKSYIDTIFDEGWSLENFFETRADLSDCSSVSDTFPSGYGDNFDIYEETTELFDGSEQTFRRFYVEYDEASSHHEWGPINITAGEYPNEDRCDSLKEPEWEIQGGVSILNGQEWTSFYDELLDAQGEVIDGLTTWTTEIYGEVQAGNIDTSEIMSARMFSERSAEEDLPQVKADLIALNLDVDLDSRVTLETQRHGVNWQMSGMLAATTSPANGFETDIQYEPNAGHDDEEKPEIGSVYLAMHPDDAKGDWEDYEKGIDGGVLTITSEPWENHTYQLETIAGETVSIPSNQFQEDDNGTWYIDVSNDLDHPITEVEDITIYWNHDEYAQVQIDSPFTITSITDEETGETRESVDTKEPTQMHTDNNYVTEEEFEQLRKDRQEYFDRLEELFKEVDGGSGGAGLPSLWDTPNIREYAIAGAAGLGLLGLINALTG